MRWRKGRLSRRERIERNNAADAFYAGAAGVEPRHQVPLPQRRAPRKPSGKPLERDILKAVIAALRRDPRVAQVERQQSGLFVDGDRYIRVGTPGALDIKGMLKGGRAFEFEIKRPGRKPDPRQAERIETLRANGAVAGVATSVEEALALLPEA